MTRMFPHLHQASDLINIHHQPPLALFKFLHLHLAEQNSKEPSTKQAHSITSPPVVNFLDDANALLN
ncbi:hypothetical protein DERP_008695 [Dermatophagoides pteronyssinus]|uniref:Uncharacterized protein n=1 Tax=Dermatophagoides pteronyssinus TaxID=6956 RepID=A0ABQ8IW27_DERPT|nr:hypothetical protein DERP_008695 [Dermatophagoides pteronyssinus]